MTESNQSSALGNQQLQNPLGTFQQLLDEYAEDLRLRGKVKAKEIKKMFEAQVSDQFPDLVSKPARNITPADIAEILTRLLQSKPRRRGIGNTTPVRESNMRATTDTLHTYLRAAFKKAKAFELAIDGGPVITNHFALVSNPAEAVRALDEA